jgi:hypothetical protein
MNSFPPIKIPLLFDDNHANHITDVVKGQDYDQLLNECYDAIPLNNIKKIQDYLGYLNNIKNFYIYKRYILVSKCILFFSIII